MSVKFPRRFWVWYDDGEGGYSAHRVTARSSLEAGAQFMRDRPGVEMGEIVETGKREIKFALDRSPHFL